VLIFQHQQNNKGAEKCHYATFDCCKIPNTKVKLRTSVALNARWNVILVLLRYVGQYDGHGQKSANKFWNKKDWHLTHKLGQILLYTDYLFIVFLIILLVLSAAFNSVGKFSVRSYLHFAAHTLHWLNMYQDKMGYILVTTSKSNFMLA